MRKLDLYTFIYNDEDLLPFFLDYYSFVDRITFIDSGSNDNSFKIIQKFAVPSAPIVRICQTGLDWWDHNVLHEYRNNIWKDSLYDLVLFPDCDEVLYHQTGLRNFLNRTRNDVYSMEGFEMVGEFPAPGTSITDIKTGVPFYPYNKSTIFNPKIDISFPNAHLRYTPVTNINLGEVKLLHYRNLGFKYMKFRIARERSRLPQNCKIRSFWTDNEIKERINDLKSKAVNVI
jgi:hypothetical protein